MYKDILKNLLDTLGFGQNRQVRSREQYIEQLSAYTKHNFEVIESSSNILKLKCKDAILTLKIENNVIKELITE
jgi:hypothetical protein